MTDNQETRIANLEKYVDRLRCRNCELWVVVAFLLGAQFASNWTFWQFLFAVIVAGSVITFIVRRSTGSASLDALLGRYTRPTDDSPPRAS